MIITCSRCFCCFRSDRSVGIHLGDGPLFGMGFQLSLFGICVTLFVLAFPIPGSADASDEASGQASDCLESSGSNCSEERGYEECPDPSICGSGATQGNLPLAFGLTIGAGLSTTIGALVPCVPLVKKSNKFILSAALATAGGVMLYVSFTEIFIKAQDYLCCAIPSHSYLLATIALFLGVAFTILLEISLKLLQRVECSSARRHLETFRASLGACSGVSLQHSKGKLASNLHIHTANPLDSRAAVGDDWNSSEKEKCSEKAAIGDSTDIVQICVYSESTSTSSPSEENGVSSSISNIVLASNANNDDDIDLNIQNCTRTDVELEKEVCRDTVDEGQGDARDSSTKEMEEVVATLGDHSTHLQQMGLLTALALCLHNFPEGLATFIAALSDPSLGITLTLAIALHNIPEGMCVSMPVYYATGSRLKAFIWAFLSGVSEPIGALVGWLVLNDLLDSHGPVIYGVAFGLIAGLMIYLSLKELIPMSYRFDSTGGTIVTIFLLVGMIIMALSLVLFEYA